MEKMSRFGTKKVLKYIKRGAVSKLRSFLRRNDVNLDEIRDNENRGVLHLACYLGESKMTRFLLRCGVDPCSTDNNGNTAIHVALKYALEFNNENVFLNLIVPLKKKSKRVMQLRNTSGETPNALLDKLQEALRDKISKNKNDEEKQNRMKDSKSDVEKMEENEWYAKLAYEESCEDYYFKENHDSLPGNKNESYNEWAERIRREYHAKHCKTTTPQSSAPSKEKHQNVQKESLTKKLAKQHDEYMNKVKLKRIKSEKEQYEHRCEVVFESKASGELTFETIPWPCPGSAADMVDKLVEWANEDKLVYLKKQRVRWHPDKFAQRCQDRIKEDERENIMDLVKQISQGINMIICSL